MDTQTIPPEQPPPTPTLDQVRHVVNNYPLIDNHAHNLLLPSHIDTIPFESITSEAQGRALRDTFKSLPHLRAARQLRELYQCSEDADWEEILEQREEWLRTHPEKLYQECFKGTHALLMDDGLAGPEKVYDYSWHDRCAQAPTKRIVRIETIAERIMQGLLQDSTTADLDEATYYTDTWITFTDEFEREIQDAIRDPEVAGFKTVICYRTGLDIEPDYVLAAKDVGSAFERYVERGIRKRKFRIERKALNDYLVLRTLEILSEHLPDGGGLAKPLQLHTGLGDNDINLREANPAFLQPLIENYPRVPFVLLHSAYPYTREAGYLATVYKHVYLDIGEVFPMVSRDGQRAILRQSLELVPGSKLLYSTDGHWFPETYWLANKQFREVWLDLLIEYIEKRDLTPHQAINLTKDLLFNNSNALYNLHYQAQFSDLVEPAKSLPWRPHPEEPPPVPRTPVPESAPPPFPPPPKAPQVYDLQLFETFMSQHPDVKYIYVQWLDFMAQIRARIVPIKEFTRMMHAGSRIGISQGNTGTLQNDATTPVVNPVGQIYVEPDLRSLRPTHNRHLLQAATVMSYWRDENGLPLRSCPRSNLETLLSDLQYNHATSLTLGFEIEVTFLRRNNNTTTPTHPDPLAPLPTNPTTTYTPLTTTHAWSTLTPSDFLHLPLLADIASALESTNIDLQQFHAESGPGQYEFVLAPLPALAAIDTLLLARQTIHQIAALHNVRATLHPQPIPSISSATSAAHVHASLEPAGDEKRDKSFFVGGVLRHLRALCAFGMPEAASYARVREDVWTGGLWCAWGSENREVPLRRVGREGGRWEVRCVDGFANMYFVVAALVGAGLLGLRQAKAQTMPIAAAPLSAAPGADMLTQAVPPPFPPPPPAAAAPAINETAIFAEKDVTVNPSTLTAEQRAALGVREQLPKTIDEALLALDADGELRDVVGEGLVYDYLAMKRSELGMVEGMGEEGGREWLVERY